MTKSRDHLRGILYLRYSTHNMNTMKNFLLCSALLGLMAWSGCKKEPCTVPTNPDCVNYCFDPTDPDCDGYDPCTAETPVSAEFRIIENGSFGPMELYDTMYFDTFYTGDLITEAIHQHPDWSYQWRIGSGAYEGVSTALDYRSAGYGEAITMTLMVEGPPNIRCFPDDDGRDTVTKIVYRGDPWESKVYGSYHGYLNGNPDDTITISLLFFPELMNDPDQFATPAINLKRGCSWRWENGVGTARKLKFSNGGNVMCDNPRGLLTLDPEKTADFDQVLIEYSLWDREAGPDLNNRKNFRFEGRRVP